MQLKAFDVKLFAWCLKDKDCVEQPCITLQLPIN